MVKPLISVNFKSKNIMVISWLDTEGSQGELVVALNKKELIKLLNLEEARKFLAHLLGLLLLSDDTGRLGEKNLQTIISGFLASTASTVYPYAYIFTTLPGSEEGTDEQRSQVLTTFHRVSKLPLGVMRIGEPIVDVDVADSSTVALAAAVAIASMAAGRGRRGYTLSLTLAQSLLPILAKAECSSEREAIIKLLAATVSYIYTYYKFRVVSDEGELIRYFMAKPPNADKEWEKLYTILLELYTRILCTCKPEEFNNLRCFKGALSLLSRETPKAARHNGHGSDPVFGRASMIADRILEAINRAGGKYDEIVTVATEQWGLLQRYIMSLALNSSNGRLKVLYTQEVVHNIILERYLSEALGMSLLSSDRIEYIPTSATDSYAIRRTIDDILSSMSPNDKVLVVAQGPATVALQLYATAKKKGIKNTQLL
jgi:hypothetical protein